jgi:hypothetical protein
MGTFLIIIALGLPLLIPQIIADHNFKRKTQTKRGDKK